MSVLSELAEKLDEVIQHRVDVVTDSEWFEELLERKIRERLEELRND